MQEMVRKEGSFEFLVFSFELWNPDTSGWDFYWWKMVDNS